MISREEALELLKAQNPEPHMVSHALETEAVMRGVARKLNQDEELWGLTGLLHDLDFPQTKDRMEEHALVGAKMLEGKLPEQALNAIRAHNEATGHTPKSDFDFALRCSETVTGLVSAAALVRPTGMEGMKPKSLKKKMKDKAFAAAVNREIIRECERLGLDLGDFLQTAIDAITPIADQVGLAK